jgi:triphosphatase
MTTNAPSRSKRPGAKRKRTPAPRAISVSKRKPAKLTADLPAGRALETVMVSAADHVRLGRGTLLSSDDPEGPHQVRVGLRRLRSALHGFRPYLKPELAQEFVKQCRALGRTVGELRDADVLVTDVVLPIRAQMECHPGLHVLLTTLQEQREAARSSVRLALEGSAWRALQVSLKRCPAIINKDQAADVPFSKVAAKALRRSWRKVDAWGSRLSTLSDTERHELRKALKTLRYQVEQFGSIYKKRQVAKFLASLRTLQNDFGYLNDVVLAQRLVTLTGTDYLGNSELHHVVGFVIGWHTARAEQRITHLEADWAALRNVPRFW